MSLQKITTRVSLQYEADIWIVTISISSLGDLEFHRSIDHAQCEQQAQTAGN